MMEEKEKIPEAAIEAILFSMGESVELSKIAAAIGRDPAETRDILEQMKVRYEQEDRGIKLIELEGAFQLCTKQEYYDCLITIAQQPKKAVLTDVCWKLCRSLHISSR